MRTVYDWFEAYGDDHRDARNRAIHWICVPVILWCVIAALWALPVPRSFAQPGLWSAAAMFFAWTFYWRLSRVIGAGMLVVFALFGFSAHVAFASMGAGNLALMAAILFVLAWVGQFIGHLFERRRPSFLTDLTYLLIGPAWLLGKLLTRARIAF